jgi:phosphopantothenoylcysteine decarboxylase/phosphopantothenate--cysteine ligase
MESILKDKKIILGVTGSIAAYKTPLLARELIKAGADVHCLMTPSAKNFVTPLTLANISRNPVLIEMFEESVQTKGAWHIQLAHTCDLMIIAPCSATTLSKVANGNCDNALVTLAIALPKETPLIISPAMDSTMWLHPSTQRNLLTCEKDGAIIIPPVDGELASGIIGPGRLPDIDVIMDYITEVMEHHSNHSRYFSAPRQEPLRVHINRDRDEQQRIKDLTDLPVNTLEDAIQKDQWQTELELTQLKDRHAGRSPMAQNFYKGKKVVITAGPTYEKIDDVRFIANHSSGKMGYALAREARKLGADVTLICGPVSLITPPGVKRIDVVSAKDMYDAVLREFPTASITILSAAVADFTPIDPKDGKIKKSDVGEHFTLEMNTTQDILATLGDIKKYDQKVVGFALESQNEIENGWKKMREKNCDMIVVNSANKPRSGFQTDDNTITILTNDGKHDQYPPMSKELCGQVILYKIAELQ